MLPTAITVTTPVEPPELTIWDHLEVLEHRLTRLEAELASLKGIDLDATGPQPEAAARIIAALPPLRLK